MELEDVSEKIEWEARRVAAAFGIVKWEIKPGRRLFFVFEGFIGPLKLNWHVETVEWSALHLFRPVETGYEAICWVSNPRIHTSNPQNRNVPIQPTGQARELIARGLYRLGVEEEGVLLRIDYPLAGHEKMELRLSMPREFWPQKWLDEEGANY